MQASDLMSPEVLTASPNTSVFRIANLMKSNRVSCVVVVDGGVPVGIITERDMVRLFEASTHNPRVHLLPAGKAMSSHPVTIRTGTSLFDALVVAKSRRIRHLPVVDDMGTIVGIVTQTNLVDAYMSVLEEQRLALESALSEQTQSLKDANEELKSLALEDSLLRVGNRRAMEVDLDHTQESSLRYATTYSVALFDVDHFKHYNDSLGHLAGDQALKDVAEFLRNSVRGADRLYRYGGEELLLLLPETTPREAELLTTRLVEGIALLGIEHEGTGPGVLTVSCGVSGPLSFEGPAGSRTWQAVLNEADEALYRAKSGGRNQVVLAGSDAEPVSSPNTRPGKNTAEQAGRARDRITEKLASSST